MEKIHGSSAHISWKDGSIRFFSGGESHERFVAIFDSARLTAIFTETFGPTPVVVHGEVYGGKCQGMSATYGKELRFVAFDVKVNESWLAVPNAEEVVTKLGLEFVHYKKINTTLSEIDAERDADSLQAVRNGCGSHMREGVVLRPLIELTKNNGERIIVKHKRDEFAERKHNPKVVDLDKQVLLTNAQAIADEWVVYNRLMHVLADNPNCTGMEHTADVIKGMLADVYKESVGEIEPSKEVSAAISRRAAQLWKEYIKQIALKSTPE